MKVDWGAIRVLCFGDSNTWGYISGSHHERYDANIRWPGVLQQELGDKFEVIEEALNSRTIESEDTRIGKEGRRAVDYILPCVDSHDPIDWIVIMIGSNELKMSFNKTAKVIAEAMDRFIKIVKSRQSQFRQIQPKIILISPPLFDDSTENNQNDNKFLGAGAKSRELANLYKVVAQENEIEFVDAAPITQTGPDGAHITAESHNNLGKKVAELILEN